MRRSVVFFLGSCVSSEFVSFSAKIFPSPDMAAVCSSVHSLSPSLTSKSLLPPPSVPLVTSRLSSSSLSLCTFPLSLSSSGRSLLCASARRTASVVVCMAPQEQRPTIPNPLDFPMEWQMPRPGGRPDIFPEYSPMKAPLPPPLPCDPPEVDEFAEEDEEKRREEEGEEGQEFYPDEELYEE